MQDHGVRKMAAAGMALMLMLSVSACRQAGKDTPAPDAKTDAKEQETDAAKQDVQTQEALPDPVVNEDTAADAEGIAAGYKERLCKETKADPSEIKYSLVEDLDRDGKYEGFFFIGGDVDEEFGSCNGEVWFVNEAGIEKLHDEFTAAVNEDSDVFGIVEGADKDFVSFNEQYVTSNVTYLFYADGDGCKESVVSALGSADVDDETGDLVITVSAYDGCCTYEAGAEEPMWTGHTWKPYYCYYDRNTGDFMEYGAEDISEEELSDICGSDLVKAIEDRGYVIDRMIRRNNGIINVNYSEVSSYDDGSRSISYMNATYDERRGDYRDVWGAGETGIFESDYGGIYELYILSAPDTKASGLPDKGGDHYGVFVMSAKDPDDCVGTEIKLEDAGFDDDLLIYTPDFSALNPEPYYVVSCGLFETKDEADRRLKEVVAAGFADAYVKPAGKYIGNKYLYTMYGTEGIEILKDCVILHDVDVSLPYPTGDDSSKMDLYVYENAQFDKDADTDTFANYEKGDTPYRWIVKNQELLRTDPDAYSLNGPALSGVFKVSIEGDEILSYYGSYWWD